MVKISIISVLADKKSSFAENKYVWAYSILLENDSTEHEALLYSLDWTIIYDHGFYSNIKNAYENNLTLTANKTTTLTNIFIMNELSGVLRGIGKIKTHMGIQNVCTNYFISVAQQSAQ